MTAQDPSPRVSRRIALQLAAAALALLAAYRRIRCSAGAGVTFWWMRATKYGLVDHRLTPLFGMEIGNFSRVRSTGSDSSAP